MSVQLAYSFTLPMPADEASTLLNDFGQKPNRVAHDLGERHVGEERSFLCG